MLDIPRILYCFWFGEKMSENRLRCYSSIVESSEIEVLLITEENLNKFVIEEFPLHPGFDYLSMVHKSDYLRSYFMYFYGGGYSDIKMNSHNWEPYFQKLEISKEDFIGCKEINEKDICLPELVENKNFVSPGKYIFKKSTEFAKIWYYRTQEKMNLIYEDLKKNPGWYHPRAERGGAQGTKQKFEKQYKHYPLGWNELLGKIFHRVQFENQDKFLLDLPPCSKEEYL